MDPVRPLDKILIVDDDKEALQLLSDIIKSEGYKVITAGDGRKALKEIRAHSLDLVLLDIKLPEMDGMEVLREIKKIDKDIIVIMFTAYGGIKDAVQAMKLGAFDYITKPFDNEEIVLNIKRALQTRHLAREVEDLRMRLEEKIAFTQFVGESPQIKQALNQVKMVAATNMTVIIQGESGTGKELIARMIHQVSPRHDKPFITVDCGTLPESLVESELFGYERGAFTGAGERKEGKFETANGGTLFLDEIANLPKALQPKLLRVIQERKVQHLGGIKEIKIDVRIIVATNTILSDEVKKGRFRDDLYHRLNEFNINLPPLRERKEDIPILIKHFIQKYNQSLNKEVKAVDSKALETLMNYKWFGNVRELENTIERAVVLADGEYIELGNLPAEIQNFQEDISLLPISEEEYSIKKASRLLEISLIRKALKKTKGNHTQSARLLEISHRALLYKIKEYEIVES